MCAKLKNENKLNTATLGCVRTHILAAGRSQIIKLHLKLQSRALPTLYSSTPLTPLCVLPAACWMPGGCDCCCTNCWHRVCERRTLRNAFSPCQALVFHRQFEKKKYEMTMNEINRFCLLHDAYRNETFHFRNSESKAATHQRSKRSEYENSETNKKTKWS